MNKIIWAYKGHTKRIIGLPDITALPCAQLSDVPVDFFEGTDLFVLCEPKLNYGKFFSCSFVGYDAKSIVVQDHYRQDYAAQGKKRIYFKQQLSYITKIKQDIQVKSWYLPDVGGRPDEYWPALHGVLELTRYAIMQFDQYYPMQGEL